MHRACDESMRAQQMALETLIGEEAILTLLAIQWWSVVDHFRMNLKEIKLISSHNNFCVILPSLYVSIACDYAIDPNP